ncbi:unnamed protein product [Dibothriocephalus latus]|uniref:Uncharacterized protein n=1 Tax=Dibothriocephalus latus TaxID=60516 RepID=A0A3P7NUS8_DIBLA|nr:unnamed protein product [Dibothriocephalus latus]
MCSHKSTFQRYVTELRNKNLTYKQKRGILSHLKAEKGILSRTVDVLKTVEKQCKRQLDAVESAQGVSGYWETMNKLEKVSYDVTLHLTLAQT